MSAAMEGRSGTTALDGARMFSRVMSWVCPILAVAMLAGTALHYQLFVTDVAHGMTCPAAPPKPRAGSFTTCEVFSTVTTPDGRTYRVPNPPPEKRPHAEPETYVEGALVEVPNLLLAIAVWQASRFFALVARGQAFRSAAVRRLRNFSVLGVLFLVANPLMEPLANAILKPLHGHTVHYIAPFSVYQSPHGSSAWSLSTPDLMNIIFAAVLVSMVSVLARAAAIAEDHAQIV